MSLRAIPIYWVILLRMLWPIPIILGWETAILHKILKISYIKAFIIILLSTIISLIFCVFFTVKNEYLVFVIFLWVCIFWLIAVVFFEWILLKVTSRSLSSSLIGKTIVISKIPFFVMAFISVFLIFSPYKKILLNINLLSRLMRWNCLVNTEKDTSWIKSDETVFYLVSENESKAKLASIKLNGKDQKILSNRIKNIPLPCQISKDGEKIAFVVEDAYKYPQYGLCILKINAAQEQIFKLENLIGLIDFSPDGSKISAATRGLIQKITVIDIDSKDMKEIEAVEADIDGLRWSKDGRYLYWSQYPFPIEKNKMMIKVFRFDMQTKNKELVFEYDKREKNPTVLDYNLFNYNLNLFDLHEMGTESQSRLEKGKFIISFHFDGILKFYNRDYPKGKVIAKKYSQNKFFCDTLKNLSIIDLNSIEHEFFSPDERYVLFDFDGHIYVYDLASERLGRLTRGTKACIYSKDYIPVWVLKGYDPLSHSCDEYWQKYIPKTYQFR